MFQAAEYFPHVYHIQDNMGVCMTCVAGESEALLFDTGYGLENVQSFIRSLTSLPLTVVLSHGHHDHALGARWFDRVQVAQEDIPVYATYTDHQHTMRVIGQAEGKGIRPCPAYLDQKMPLPGKLEETLMDLGGIHISLLKAPGHTPGSLMAYIHEHRLLLTGDNWNPETWCFFPEAEPVTVLLDSLRKACGSFPLEYVLCPHDQKLHMRKELTDFLLDAHPAALLAADSDHHGDDFHVPTRLFTSTKGFRLVFDYKKALSAIKEGNL